MPVPQSVLVFGEPGIKRNDPDWYAALLDLNILGSGGLTSRVALEVREKRGLAYSVSASLDPLDHAASFSAKPAARTRNAAQAIDVIRATWQRMHDDGPTAKELADAKTYITGSFPLGLDFTGRIAAILVRSSSIILVSTISPSATDHQRRDPGRCQTRGETPAVARQPSVHRRRPAGEPNRRGARYSCRGDPSGSCREWITGRALTAASPTRSASAVSTRLARRDAGAHRPALEKLKRMRDDGSLPLLRCPGARTISRSCAAS